MLGLLDILGAGTDALLNLGVLGKEDLIDIFFRH